MLNTTEQLNQLIETSRRPLIVFAGEKNDDAAAAAAALSRFLATRGKRAEIACSGYQTPAHLSFLPKIEEIKPTLSYPHQFTIKVDVSKTKIETLSYDIKDGWLSIHLNPREGAITKNDLRTLQTGFKYDLIFVLGAADLESLGDIFFNNTDLFYRTPLINIDQQANNEHYGTLNLVNPTATSIAETLYHLFEQLGFQADTEIVTAILTGMIARTRSFKIPNVTPQTLNLASRLIDLGADREKIIQRLYRTKTIAALKLWGSALINLQIDKAIGLVYTSLTREDFVRSGAKQNDLEDLTQELIANSPEAKLILIVFEDTEKNKIHGRLTVEKHLDALRLLKNFSPRGNNHQAEFTSLNISLKEVEEKAVAEIKKQHHSNPEKILN